VLNNFIAALDETAQCLSTAHTTDIGSLVQTPHNTCFWHDTDTAAAYFHLSTFSDLSAVAIIHQTLFQSKQMRDLNQ